MAASISRRSLLRWLRFAVYATAALLVPLCGALVFFETVRYKITHARPGTLKVPVEPGPLTKCVNPFVGTGGYPWICGNNFPGAAMPFGMVRLSPDTASPFIDKQALNYSGYYYGDNKILGFSHTRIAGPGIKEGGSFRITPTTASAAITVRKRGWTSRFSHTDEVAVPGYYAVKLPEPGILAELAATTRVGLHRYTYSQSDTPCILLDVSSGIGGKDTRDGYVRVLPAQREIEGSTVAMGGFSVRYGGLKTYFVARFSRPFKDYAVWQGDQTRPGVDQAEGYGIGAQAGFAASETPFTLEAAVAVSYVSIENARLNLEQELGALTFNEVAAKTGRAWEDTLARIRIQGGTETQRRIYYTGLYHAFQMPTTFTDVNGEYFGFDKAVHTAEGWQYYTDFSLWDSFRTVHPLFNLIAPQEQRDMLRSLVAMCKQGGWLPRWPAGAGYTNSMFGTPADIVVAESYLKGIRDFDVETAYASMKSTALGPTPGHPFSGRDGIKYYLKYGYCPSDLTGRAVSRTLEYCWADHAISLLAGALERHEDAAVFADHARYYRNLWNSQTQYFHPRDSQGSFSPKFDPFLLTYFDRTGEYTHAYVEGSALQWRWGPFYDPDGLVGLFKSTEFFIDELNHFFEKSTPGCGEWNPGPYYWQGNEPDIHAAYLFNSAGRPDLTQKWARWIMDNKYADAYDGLDGNDDCGTLSAWYVLSALGFYPVAGSDRYQVGTPLFPEAEIILGPGKTLHIVTANYAPRNLYVQRVTINDKPLDRTWFTHDEIANGGTLRFEMGSSPSPGK